MNCLTEHSSILSPTKPERKVSSDRFGLYDLSDVVVLSHIPRKPGRKTSGELLHTKAGSSGEGQSDSKREPRTPLKCPKSYSLPCLKTAPSREAPQRASTSKEDTPVTSDSKEDNLGHFSPRKERQQCRLSRSLNDVLLSSEISSEFSQEMLKSPPRRPRREWERPEKRGSMNDSLFASPSCCPLTPNGTLVDSPPRQPVRMNAASPTTV